jgi:hypothetical protein
MILLKIALQMVQRGLEVIEFLDAMISSRTHKESSLRFPKLQLHRTPYPEVQAAGDAAHAERLGTGRIFAH